jgi:hypothetical protein
MTAVLTSFDQEFLVAPTNDNSSLGSYNNIRESASTKYPSLIKNGGFPSTLGIYKEG